MKKIQLLTKMLFISIFIACSDSSSLSANTDPQSSETLSASSSSIFSEAPTSSSTTSTDLLETLRLECMNFNNDRRAELSVSALGRWTRGEACADSEALADQSGAGAHGSFGSCGEYAQNTCPGWPTDSSIASHVQVLRSCMQSMWDEGPGEPYSAHGHYINMSNADYSELACGFSEVNGNLWVNMNYQ
ncbi:MAG: hypothetical protein AUK31_08405 [Fibrobacteres bacterium CG2_30_45_31]|nr:MAG: hypothetical protein AUK31_08405 [Fibrobacteres bacterium CG2_30_45_31]